MSDQSSVEVMHRLREAMVADAAPTEALAIASTSTFDDLATAGAFVAPGS